VVYIISRALRKYNNKIAKILVWCENINTINPIMSAIKEIDENITIKMNYIKYNNFINLFLTLFLIKIIGIICISSGANEPIPDNELQLTARDCSYQYCYQGDGLSLWLSLTQFCSGDNVNPYFLEINSQEATVQETNFNVSPIVSASLCAMSSVCSLMLGYVIAHHYHKKVVYTQVKMEDDF